MEKLYNQYGNIIRVLRLDNDITQAIMIDVNMDQRVILSRFDASKKFDSDFIQSFLNILSESAVGFRLLSDNSEDRLLKEQAEDIITSLTVCLR